jgi:hypothetical protein
MSEVPVATDARIRRLRLLTPRGWFLLLSSAALGALVWRCQRHWYSGALAAISLWIIVGLMAQVHDIWRSRDYSRGLPSEERWAWRFAVAWRPAIACLMAACFVVQCLIALHVLVFDDGDVIYAFSRQICQAVLLTAIIMAIASSPRLVRRTVRCPWSPAIELLGYLAAAVLGVMVLMDHTLIAALVHMTIAGIGIAQPNNFSEGFASYSPAQITRFFDVTTAGAASVLVSCGLLRLLSYRWWRGRWQRASLIALLAASLAANNSRKYSRPERTSPSGEMLTVGSLVHSWSIPFSVVHRKMRFHSRLWLST